MSVFLLKATSLLYVSLNGPLPMVKSAIIFCKSPSFLFSYIFASKQNGTNSGYFSISKTSSIKSFFSHSINRLTEAFGINDC